MAHRYSEEELNSCACGKKTCKICNARYMRKWNSEHKDEVNARTRDYYKRVGSKKMVERHRNYMARDPETRWKQHQKTAANYRKKLRTEVIIAYGGECACCHITEEIFLSIDHIDQKGAEHRRREFGSSRGVGSYVFYLWLKRKGFPKDNFRCLCRNCQYSFFILGYCPHHPPALTPPSSVVL